MPPDGGDGAEGNNSDAKETLMKEYAVSIAWEREQAETTSSDKCDFNTVFCCCARQLGRMQVICKRRDGSPLIIIGPHWPFCVFITIPLIIALSAFILYLFAFGNLPHWIVFTYCTVLALTFIILFMVSCRDPGLVERVTDLEECNDDFVWNEQVGSYRPQNAKYCSQCKVLIDDYDHFCVWTGTGIGKKNIFYFKAFVGLVSTLICGGLSIITILIAMTTLWTN